MRRFAQSLGRDERGAVGPILAISLVGLVAAGGLAFDYARMAALDTELQNAADQAALAAAGQLDGQDLAMSRATQAAQQLVQNRTLFANDGDGPAITADQITVEFFTTYVPETGEKRVDGTLTDATADYVRVTIAPRTAEFALTPMVGMVFADMNATAFAGVGTAICNMPPIFMCNPSEPAGNTNPDYPFGIPTGTGVRLVGGTSYAPGNFGWLDDFGANTLAEALGWNTPPGECKPVTGVTTKPGVTASVFSSINTRFDVASPGLGCRPGGTCSPSTNVRKDLVRQGTSCNWDVSPNPYRPTSTDPLPSDGSADPDIMGHPRDTCHAVSLDGVCAGGRIGTGVWDRAAYFRVNYGATFDWQAAMTAAGYNPATVTRYQVYTWELTSPSSTIGTEHSVGGGQSGIGVPVCNPPGLPPAGNVDRRRISLAVINCEAHALSGRGDDVPVFRWMDLFLVEPAFNRGVTDAKDLYVEVIDETVAGNRQVIRRDMPRLLE